MICCCAYVNHMKRIQIRPSTIANMIFIADYEFQSAQGNRGVSHGCVWEGESGQISQINFVPRFFEISKLPFHSYCKCTSRSAMPRISTVSDLLNWAGKCRESLQITGSLSLFSSWRAKWQWKILSFFPQSLNEDSRVFVKCNEGCISVLHLPALLLNTLYFQWKLPSGESYEDSNSVEMKTVSYLFLFFFRSE